MTFEMLFAVMAVAFVIGIVSFAWFWFRQAPWRLRLFSLIWIVASGVGMFLGHGRSGVIPERNALRACIESGRTWDYKANGCAAE